jgi:maltooligosyltrehalose trehalohydrolase
MQRKLPMGAEPRPGGGVHFRVWAPQSRSVEVELIAQGKVQKIAPLSPEDGGDYFSGTMEGLAPGALYKYRVDSGSFPDPASRFQPEGPHGPSQVVDSAAFQWTDRGWKGVSIQDLVIYEMHLGTFTPEGTWRAALEQLPELKNLGVTAVEIMPIADFPGRFGWGYDGVDLFAPSRLYGSPDDARAFINAAHEAGIAVILDVVYNHVGPDGNYLKHFSPDYFSSDYECEWGEAINFDGRNSGPVREFFISNARYWIDEFHFDGLRLDATQQIFDRTTPHILKEITEAARSAARGRTLFVVAENESQHARLARPAEFGGFGLDALWNDDYHHAALVAATGRREAYYLDYQGAPQEFISAVKYGFLYQGQLYSWQKQRRGSASLDLSHKKFVVFIQNHDQVANSLRGERLHQRTGPGRLRALAALTLLSPCIPMLFQGEEFAASTPFLFFADHHPELNKLVRQGRGQFLKQFRTIATAECETLLPEPGAEATFQACKLKFSERETNSRIYNLYRDLLRIRREEPSIRDAKFIDGAVLGEHAFLIRYFSGDDRLLLVNLGPDLYLNPAPEPLLAPLEGMGWRVLWSSEDPKYGGSGTPPLETVANWILPGHSAILLKPDENPELANVKLNQVD